MKRVQGLNKTTPGADLFGMLSRFRLSLFPGCRPAACRGPSNAFSAHKRIRNPEAAVRCSRQRCPTKIETSGNQFIQVPKTGNGLRRNALILEKCKKFSED
jgi:hypothetical protein